MTDLKTDLIEYFLKTESFKHDPVSKFPLSSGVTSEFYVDCKELMGDPNAREMVAEYAFDKIKDLHFDCIGGLEIGAIAIGNEISGFGRRVAEKDWPNFVVRKQVKGHGLKKKIEGIIKKHALIVDDVLTSGNSILQAVNAMRESGRTVTHALVIVDRQEQEGKKKLENEGVELISLLTIKDFQTVEKLAPVFK